MQKKQLHNHPIRRPLGKQKPLAIDVFAEKAKQKRKEAEDKLLKLRNDAREDKRTSNQHHFTFVSSIIGGAVAANFLSLRGEGLEENVARVAIIIGVAGLTKRLNNHYAERGETYKNMLNQINSMIKSLREGNFKGQEVPDYKDLYDIVKIDTAGTKEKRRKIHKEFNNRTANIAVRIIVGAALSVYAYKAGEFLYDSESRKAIVEELFKALNQSERQQTEKLPLSPPTHNPH